MWAVFCFSGDDRLDLVLAIAGAQCAKTDKAFLACTFDRGVLSSFDLITLLFQLLKKDFKVHRLLVQQDAVNYRTQLVTIAFFGWIKCALLPLPVRLDFNNGQLMFQTNQITQSLHRKPRQQKIPEFPGAIQCSRIVDDVIQWPVSDETQVGEWNTWLGLPANGTPFTDVDINGNIASLSGGDLISAAISSPDIIGIDGLTNFTQLVSVSIGDCPNLAITPDISGLSLLGAFLCFNCTFITDMPDITEFTGLTVMDLSNSGITSIVIPAGLTQLQSISMNGCFNLYISDVDGVLAHFGTYRPAIQYVWLESLPYTQALIDAARAANPQAYFFT